MKYPFMMHVDPAVLEQLTAQQQQAMQDGHAAFFDGIEDPAERGHGTNLLVDALGEVVAELA